MLLPCPLVKKKYLFAVLVAPLFYCHIVKNSYSPEIADTLHQDTLSCIEEHYLNS